MGRRESRVYEESINQGREARKEGRYSRATPITALVAGGGVIVSLRGSASR